MTSPLFRYTAITYGIILLAVFYARFFLAHGDITDDPTCVLFAKSEPSFKSHFIMDKWPSADSIVSSDELQFRGLGLFKALADWGWIAIPLSFAFLLLIQRRSPFSHPNHPRPQSLRFRDAAKQLWIPLLLVFLMTVLFALLDQFELSALICWLWVLWPLAMTVPLIGFRKVSHFLAALVCAALSVSPPQLTTEERWADEPSETTEQTR